MNKVMRLAWLMCLSACTGDKGPTDAEETADTGDTLTNDTATSPDTGNTITVPDPEGDPATVELAGECPLDVLHGDFTVQVLDIYSTVAGKVANGVVPITVLELMGEEGGCKLLRRNNAFCDPPCQAGETCDFNGECIPYPVNQDVGTVTIGGLVEDVVLTPVVPGYQYFQNQTPHPAFQPGELIELRTWGTTYGEDIVLHGVGVETMSLGTATEWVVQDGQDFTFSWEPPTNPGRGRVHVRLNIDQHGNTPVNLFCEFDDTGSATLPASLISQLISFGVTGFPNATVTRRTVDSTTMADGCVEFEISSPISPDVLVDGYIPCNGPQDCPQGQTCDPVTFICG